MLSSSYISNPWSNETRASQVLDTSLSAQNRYHSSAVYKALQLSSNLQRLSKDVSSVTKENCDFICASSSSAINLHEKLRDHSAMIDESLTILEVVQNQSDAVEHVLTKPHIGPHMAVKADTHNDIQTLFSRLGSDVSGLDKHCNIITRHDAISKESLNYLCQVSDDPNLSSMRNEITDLEKQLGPIKTLTSTDNGKLS